MSVKMRFDFNDWWVGYRRGPRDHYIALLPTMVITWKRNLPRRDPWLDGKYVPQCGELTAHSFHVFGKNRHWCSGLCDCGMRGGPHGPGEHK